MIPKVDEEKKKSKDWLYDIHYKLYKEHNKTRPTKHIRKIGKIKTKLQ